MRKRKGDDQLLAAALERANDCPPLEELERLLAKDASGGLQQHVSGCPHCRTELEMLRMFAAGEVAASEQSAVDSIVARLGAPQRAMGAARSTAPQHESWWRPLLAMRWITPAVATAAIALVVAGVALELRPGRQPRLDTSISGNEVLRSSTIAILSPLGDLREKPEEIRWQAAPNAARYRIRIMEVDRTEVWTAEAATPRIDLPATVRSLIVPAKTLLIQIGAFDAAGHRIAESEPVRFRLLQNIYGR